jgi:transposase-like protein
MEKDLTGLTKEELSAKGLNPCPRCGAFYDPNDPKIKKWKCSLCGTDLSLSPEEVRASLLSNDELSIKLKRANKKARRLK